MSEREQGNGGNGDGDEADHSERCGVRGELGGLELSKSTGGVVREMLGYHWAFKGFEWNKYSLPGYTCYARRGRNSRLGCSKDSGCKQPGENGRGGGEKRAEADIPRNERVRALSARSLIRSEVVLPIRAL